MSEEIPRLTGGILFGLLLQARKLKSKARNSFGTGSSDKLSDTDVMWSLVEIFTGNEQQKPDGKSLKKNVSDYKKCIISSSTYLPFSDTGYIKNFDEYVKQNQKDTLQAMSTFIDDKLDSTKLPWLISGLIEILRDDETISNSEKFKISKNKSVAIDELVDVDSIEIEPFLLDIMRYIFVKEVDNKTGEATFKDWYSNDGANTVWRFVNTDIGEEFSQIRIEQYKSVGYVEDDEQLQDKEEVIRDSSIKDEDQSEHNKLENHRCFNNPKIINQYATNIYNIEHVDNINKGE